jgi:glycosyltransferase involved in cell wall biosynthesis
MKSVSVVLTCYDGARWISKAIESILAQTYKDFELLIIDDGSKDDSKEIASSYLCDNRMRYIYQENRGFSGAVNRGIKESIGSLVGFIGQDDLWMPNKLELQVKYLDEHKDVDLVHSRCYSINSEDKIIKMNDVKMPNCSSTRSFIEQLFLNNFIGFETVLLKRKCFDKIGFFDERMVGFSDHDMWLRIAGEFNIAYVNSSLVKKREHALQFSKNMIEQGLRDEFLLVNKAIHQYPFLKKVERKKLASLYYALGTVMLQKENDEKAKQNFLKAFKCRPWELKAIMAYIAPALYRSTWDRYQQSESALHRGMRWVEG